MRNNSTLLFIFLSFSMLMYSCQQRNQAIGNQNNNKVTKEIISGETKGSDCKKFIELHSAGYLAKEYGKSEMWVLNNVKINLWQNESSKGKGRKVGSLLPGSRALIIKTGNDDYKVKSPYDKSIGWISKIQVSRTLIQNVNTYEPCE